MNSLCLTKLRFTLIFTTDTHLSTFIGNTIRGALGQSLCDNFRHVYDDVFKVKSGESIPNPFVLSVPFPSKGKYIAGDALEFSITLFGTACNYDEEIVNATQLMCKGKLANTILTKAELEYSREWNDSHVETIPLCDTLTLNFITPTEVLTSKHPVYEPDFSTFVDSLFGRISAIIDNYGENEFIISYSLIAKKPQVDVVYDLKHIQINSNNYSINGFIGKIIYSGDVTRYLPYIDLGSQLHLGKKTTRSCGEYTFEI